MTKLLIMASSSLMTLLVFTTVALAQGEGGQPAATNARGEVERVDEPVTPSEFADTATTTATAAATATATATAGPTATAAATASPTSTATASPTATATATALPKSGGPLPVVTLTLIASLALIGSGVAALVLLRRSLA